MKKVIVTTTIRAPSLALKKFDLLEDWTLVVAGDLKTPKDFNLERGIYLNPEVQSQLDPQLSEAIGWNCVQRRNFALLWAHRLGADVIAVVDDDNIPKAGWGDDVMVGREIEVNYYSTHAPAFDPVGATNHPHLWHRGFPLQLVASREYGNRQSRRIKVDVQAGFWDGDPDIDAFCRMEHEPVCAFEDRYFPIASNQFAPFNSQNTIISKDYLRDYFLFPQVGRMDDIWAAYYLQAKGAQVVFDRASVHQERNPHDLTHDMKQEYLGYEHNLEIVSALRNDPQALFKFLPERALRAFALYQAHFD